jgi:hypothetical protein
MVITFYWYGAGLHEGRPVATGELAQAADNGRYDSV